MDAPIYDRFSGGLTRVSRIMSEAEIKLWADMYAHVKATGGDVFTLGKLNASCGFSAKEVLKVVAETKRRKELKSAIGRLATNPVTVHKQSKIDLSKSKHIKRKK